MPSSPPQDSSDEMDEDEDEQDEYAEEHQEAEEEAGAESMYEEENHTMDFNYSNGPGFQSINPSRTNNAAYTESQADDDYEEPRGLKRSRYGEIMGTSFRSSRMMQLEKRTPAIPAIAKGLATKSASVISEPDDCILQSERLLSKLNVSFNTGSGDDLETLAIRTAQHVAEVWQKYTQTRSLPASIGPKDQKSNIDKANYLASLLLRLHHPFVNEKKSRSEGNNFGRSSRYMDLILQTEAVTTVPKALLDWLNTYHNPFPDDVRELLEHRPAPVAHEKFWDMMYAITLRGDIATAIELLENADFSIADSALEDGYEEPGYVGHQLTAVRYVTSRCVDLLKSCPAFIDGDWDVKNANWSVFRSSVRRELQDLEAYAEGGNADRDNAGGNVFGQSSFGASRTGMSFSTASRRAESKVPWTIYESLKTLYGQLQGLQTEIMVATQDWLEATIYLTVWWDGEDDDAIPGPNGNLAASRRSLRQSQQIRPVDVSPTTAYRRQLTYAFASVTDEPEDTVFGVNTMNPLHVGLACIFEDDVQGVIRVLQAWSLPIVSAVVELAGTGGWLPRGSKPNDGFMDGFDQDDLMVLNHGQDKQSDGFNSDNLLIEYANLLSKKDQFKSSDGRSAKEGWDLACRVLSRLHSLETAQRKIEEILSHIELNSPERVDRVLAVCDEIGLPDQVRSIAEVSRAFFLDTCNLLTNVSAMRMTWPRPRNPTAVL